MVKDSSDPEDFQFFLESFPDSGLSKVARLKLRMIKKKEQKTKEPPKTAERKPEKKKNKYWENKSLKQQWIRNDHDEKREFLGALAACNRLFYSGHGWQLPSREDFYRSFDDLIGKGLMNEGDEIWANQRSGFEALFFGIPESLDGSNLFNVKNNPIWVNLSSEKGFLCVRKDDFDIEKMRTVYKKLLLNKSLLALKSFVNEYSNEKRAETEVAAIRRRIRSIKKQKDSLTTWRNPKSGLLWQRKDLSLIHI